MRTIYYTEELIKAILDYPLRKHVISRTFWSLLLTMLLTATLWDALVGRAAVGHAIWLIALGIYVTGKICLYFFRRRRHRSIFNEAKYGKTRSFQMMMDNEKIIVDEDDLEVTTLLEDITDVADFRGYIVVENTKGSPFLYPSEQLLNEELNILDEVRRRLRKKGGLGLKAKD